ncbi:hypothetical protein SAMN05216515_11515 [Eubacterium pyruvativorans]|uniref:Leucine rich repeat-containing protein n=1 Tax=Eubacterium pyruvativorans TaxID=155865 RepID=A0A1I7H9Y6_9FIRM|nr:hypothetical protein [Eubacterium pyruvativorans]SFO23345.1 hypothetical protein SAMN05216515_11515 [Eubacterium pyruvativorans]SFU57561.1 hypothetical protein SAMN05216508_11415 [Eubacterium pyruvativorans]
MLSGYGNWKIKYVEEEGGILLLRAVTCDRDAVLPAEIDGVPVTGIWNYAMGPKDHTGKEEGTWIELEGAGGDGEKKWSNAGIRSLTLPESVRFIGEYAFHGMYDLEKLELFDVPVTWCAEACQNWFSLHEIIIRSWQGGQGNLAYLCEHFSAELDVRIFWEDGRTARLLFPEYLEVVTENTPARQFVTNTEGFGYPYHHLFRGGQLSFGLYDGEWEYALSHEAEDPEGLLTLAWYRLYWPEGLQDRFREGYQKYVSKNRMKLLDRLIREDAPGQLEKLLKLVPAERAELDRGCETARTLRRTACLAVLMQQIRGLVPAGRKKSFDL